MSRPHTCYTVVLVCLIVQVQLWQPTRQWTGMAKVPKGQNSKVPMYSHESTAAAKLPNWRITTDCSIFDWICVSRKHNHYDRYPFTFHLRSANDNYQWTWLSDNNTHTIEWLKSKPFYKKILNSEYHSNHSSQHIETKWQRSRPVPLSFQSYQSCLHKVQTVPYTQQLRMVIESLSKKFGGFLSFTISDYAYARDTMHDVFAMTNDIVGFRQSFFLVALDNRTVDLACTFGYPVIARPGLYDSDLSLKTQVQQTKFRVSRDLLLFNQSFLFFEMDIFWVQSPTILMEQAAYWDMLVSAHQEHIFLPNIGVYLVNSNERTKQFFDLCYNLLQDHPQTFDQFIFWEVWSLNRDPLLYNFTKRQWKPRPPKETPRLAMTVNAQTMDGQWIAAQANPIIHEETLAVHPLCTRPLSTPHGKKMIAKELGVWYGSYDYYTPHRYIMLDGRTLGGAYDLTEPVGHEWGYAFDRVLQFTIGILVVLAQLTNRILILPKIVHHKTTTFLWTILDLQSIEDLVEFRETNFVYNRKSWYNEKDPFERVARTALGVTPFEKSVYQLFGQRWDTDHIDSWKFDPESEFASYPLEAWLQLLLSPGYDDASLLLVNPQFVYDKIHTLFLIPPGEWLRDKVYDLTQNKLKWCKEETFGARIENLGPATKVTAEDDCYLLGKTLPPLKRRQRRHQDSTPTYS